jgi:hypothetical protein
MVKKLWIATVTVGITMLAGCGDSAQPAPDAKEAVTQQKESSRTPVAVQPDATAANTGNLVNGPQSANTKK